MRLPRRKFDVTKWTDAEALRRYSQRRNDLEIMLRRFQCYVSGNSAADSPLSDKEITDVAQLVFQAGVEMKHLDHGSTSETSSPLIDILTSDSALAQFKGKDMPLMLHAYTVQCEGAHELATASRTSTCPRQDYSQWAMRKEVRRAEQLIKNGEEISLMIDDCRPRSHDDVENWQMMLHDQREAISEVPSILKALFSDEDLFVFARGRFRISISAFFTRDGEEKVTFPLDTETVDLTFYRHAKDESELANNLLLLLPFAKRMDSRSQTMDPDMQIAPAIAWALDEMQAGCTEIQIVDRIRNLTHRTADRWLWKEQRSLLASMGNFVIAFVGAHFCNLKKMPGLKSAGVVVENLVQDMQRSLRLLKFYATEPASEPQGPKEASQEVEELQKSKRQLIGHNEKLRKENAELERENKRLKTTKTEKEKEAEIWVA